MPILLLFLAFWAIAWPAKAALTDLDGHPVPAKAYHRIVSLAPSNTELLYAIGWGNRVVGVSEASDYPPAAKQKPSVGGAQSLNVERVLALHPDLILAISSQSPALAQLAKVAHAPVVILPSDSLDSIARNAEELGHVIGPAGTVFAARFRRDLRAIAPSHQQPHAFYLVWDQPLMSAGPKTFLDDLMRRAGGQNVVTVPGYTQYSEERLVAAAPSVVLYPDNLHQGAERLKKRLPKSRFVALPASEVSRPGPRILHIIRQVARLFDTP